MKENILKEFLKNKRINTQLISGLSLVLFSFLFQLILSGCSTDKNAFANKSFHYTTTRFNGYFHGREALKEAKKALYKAHVDDYEHILSVYKYGNKSQADGQATSLNRAIAKASKMIDRHSMKFKSKGKKVEVNKMIDDCYLLLGEAKFCKMQYDSALHTFKYMLGQFEGQKMYYPAYLELIKTYIYLENYVDAETKMKALEEDEKFPKKYQYELNVLKSLYYIETEDYDKAIQFLKLAIPEVRGAKFKVRLKYILAQLHTRKGDNGRASELFEEVAKKAVYYEMEFNAKLSLAKTHEGKDKDKIISILRKMLKDSKNKDFKDQIYFTLAQVYQRAGMEEESIENYKLSAQTSVNNPKQKALSYLAVADYYFKKPAYIDAQMFYDSSLITLPKEFPNYDVIKDKAESLTELVGHINTVQREDSLQAVAAMTDEERQVLIDGIIENVEKDEEAAELAQQAKLEQMKAAAALQTNTGGWLFDNPSLLASANAEFITLFGNRTLEDNWRRSDKSSSSISAIESNEDEKTDEFGNQKVAENKTADFYLKDVPFTQAAVDSSNEKIKVALYQAAIIFKDKLNDVPQSNYYFEELNRRFPKNENRAKSLYQLYRNYETTGQTTEAEQKKNMILADFPKSEYAQLIKNPNKGAEEEAKKAQVEEYYKALYALYNQGQMDEVRKEISAIESKFEENHLMANFALLDAFAVGKLHGKDSFEVALKTVANVYPGTTPADDAQVLLDQYNAVRMNARAKEAKVVKDRDRNFDTTKVGHHFYAIIVADSVVSGEELMNRIQTYNSATFPGRPLTTTIADWEKGYKIILIKKFRKIMEGKLYVRQLRERVLNGEKNMGKFNFLVSEENFFKLNKFKEKERYLGFYRKNY